MELLKSKVNCRMVGVGFPASAETSSTEKTGIRLETRQTNHTRKTKKELSKREKGLRVKTKLL